MNGSSHRIHLASRAARLALALALGASSAAASPLLISEVFYDASGSDDGHTFVEISGTPGTSLDGLVVEGINGSGGSVTVALALSGVVPADGLFVVADLDGGGATNVAEADLLLDFDFQNGPDSVVLRQGDVVVDALGYGEFAPGEVFAGEGMPALDVPAGSSLARVFANLDRDDNASDWVELTRPTPGAAAFAPVPEPGVALLLGLGLAGLASVGRR